jgi:penicillin-binding protein 1B
MDRLSRLIEALSGVAPAPHPSLLLGAVDMSPYQVAQLYQFLGFGWTDPTAARQFVRYWTRRSQPLAALRRAPLHLQRRAMRSPRDLVELGAAGSDPQRHRARACLRKDWRRSMAPAGKTGTSNDGRDSWFAGYTGSYLGVVWVGNDDNAATGLYGASGAMRVWAKTFSVHCRTHLCSWATKGVEWVWLHPRARGEDRSSRVPAHAAWPSWRAMRQRHFDGCPLARCGIGLVVMMAATECGCCAVDDLNLAGLVQT